MIKINVFNDGRLMPIEIKEFDKIEITFDKQQNTTVLLKEKNGKKMVTITKD